MKLPRSNQLSSNLLSQLFDRFFAVDRRLPVWVMGCVLPTGAALLFLLLWAKSQSVNLAEHNRYVAVLRQLQEQDARINQSLLQLRLGLLNNYDPIVDKQAGIRALHRELALPPRFVGNNSQQIQAQVQESQQLWQEKNGLVEQFKSSNSVLRNSLAYFPIAVETLSSSSEIMPETATRIDTVLKEVLLFNLSTVQADSFEIEQEIEQIGELAGSSNGDVVSTMAHANVILEKSVETDELIEQSLRIPTRRQGLRLAETYDSAYQQAVRAANLYRFGLYLLLTVMVVVIAASIISKLRTSTVRLRKATEDAQVANRAKSQFLSNMSHELRTPLNVILGFVQLMARNGSLNPQQQDYLESIDQSGEHLLNLINDVLEMSKIEAGKVLLTPHEFDLHGLLKSIHTMFQFKAHSKGLQLSLYKADDLPQYVFADESKLRQVLVNLVGNAVKFTRVGGVDLRVRADDKATDAQDKAHPNKERPASQNSVTLHFEVEDTGPGIPAEDVDMLFDPFVQAKNRATSAEGTGLGLPISRRFVELMGGEISLVSHIDAGSRFVFSVKAGVVKGYDSFSKAHRTVVGLAANQPVYRILVVEDRPKSRQLLVDLLLPVGFEVKEARNGLEALSVCQDWQPDLIWMDLRMPIMDGYEATRQIKSKEIKSKKSGRQPIIIIALTGNAFISEQQRAIAAGCDDFVCKPFRAETLFEKIADYLDVQYIYKASVRESAVGAASDRQQRPSNSSIQMTADDFQTMPADWVARVHEAATKVNGKEITCLLEEVPSEREKIRLGLNQLVDSFSFEEIVSLTKAD